MTSGIFFKDAIFSYSLKYIIIEGVFLVVIMLYLDLQLPVQSVPITTKFVSSNLVHVEEYLIQHYVI